MLPRIQLTQRVPLWRRTFLGIGFITMLLMTLSCRSILSRSEFGPEYPFDEREPPAAPDYADPASWMALPTIEDRSDLAPDAAQPDPERPDADLFWVHPTIFWQVTNWNQEIAYAGENEDITLQAQASLFNTCCRIYAPRYREATFAAFLNDNEDGHYFEGDFRKAVDLAYEDVANAFRYYMENENDGRPFIIAGHSQGSFHLDRLLREEIWGSSAADQLIVAYIPGYHIQPSDVPVCQTADQTGCLVSWNAALDTHTLDGHSNGDICVNPLTWREDNEPADFAQNLGTVHYVPGSDYPIESGVADGRCANFRLEISEIRSDVYAEVIQGEYDLHPYDYSLFYFNIRENAALRIAAYWAEQ